jgi:hypothetical protein
MHTPGLLTAIRKIHGANSMPINERADKPGLACSTCLRLKHFYPLLGYLLTTVLITYGIAIPRSCLAGVNAQSVGFGAAMIAAAVAYWQGIRIALHGGAGLCLKHWIPLITFLTLATVIGYGFIIPGSCIAGVNQNSMGFGVSLLFVAVVYAQGVRRTLPRSAEAGAPVCVKPMRLRHFYPLLGFITPTLLIGYGVVIPRSGIPATSEAGLGFGMALFGACAAYWQGVRLALREDRSGPTGKKAA